MHFTCKQSQSPDLAGGRKTVTSRIGCPGPKTAGDHRSFRITRARFPLVDLHLMRSYNGEVGYATIHTTRLVSVTGSMVLKQHPVTHC
jgi:hypothetical protein